MSAVEQLLKADISNIARLDNPVGPGIIRYRNPVLGPLGVSDYHVLLTIVWAYGDEGSGMMPIGAVSDEMGRFEDHLCDAVQHDAHAILVAVFTFDGARQWVYYCRDLSEFSRRLSAIPDYYGQPYPIELTTNNDPTWSYLREKILRQVPADA